MTLTEKHSSQSYVFFLNTNVYTTVVLFMRILNSITEEEEIIRVIQFLGVEGYIPYIINVKRYERVAE